MMPDDLEDEQYEEKPYEMMYPEDDVLSSRRRDYLENDESFSDEEDPDEEDDQDISISSNSNTVTTNGGGFTTYSSTSYSSYGGNGEAVVDGININNLPPNYHGIKTVTRRVNGRPVHVNVTIDKKTDPATGQVSVSVSESSGSKGIFNSCNSEKPCKSGSFCEKSIVGSYCKKCSGLKMPCTEDAQCCGIGATGSLCVSGICQTGYTKGDRGTICQNTSDCKPGMCCARAFMRKNGVCKLLARLGQKCAASAGSSNALFHPWTCPCEKGLICSSGSWLESFFHGSMNTVLGGNTCRKQRRGMRGGKRGKRGKRMMRRKRNKRGRRNWMFGGDSESHADFDDDFDKE